MIPDKNFRMSKPNKTMLALAKGTKEHKNGWKKLFIDAQLHEEAARRATLRSKESENRGPGARTRGAVAPD
jgi:hypothetical protein